MSDINPLRMKGPSSNREVVSATSKVTPFQIVPRDFVRMVRTMRNCQKAYFHTRSPQLLNECRDLERRVDAMLEAMCDHTPQALLE